MSSDKTSVNKAIENIEKLLGKERNISAPLKAAIKLIIVLIKILSDRINLNSSNSSKSPSTDQKRKRGSKTKKSSKKQGGQSGHAGVRLKKIDNPDKIIKIKLDKRTLPRGEYQEVGFETRQEFDINISRVVIEYQAQILEDETGKRFVAEFPKHIKKDAQYGIGVKVNSVYMSQFQLIPYLRIQDQFADQMDLPLSTGSIFNFNKEAYNLLEEFEEIAKDNLVNSELSHVDETSININKKRYWLHTASNELWTHFYPHEKRGSEAMDDIGIIPNFKGILCHDHWKAYYKYKCLHALCNAHHKRELTRAEEQDNQKWAKVMKNLLLEINKAVDKAGGKLRKSQANDYLNRYRKILSDGDKECPEPKRKKGQKGRLKRSKSRNLLERLREFEKDTLRFMENKIVPFTNNLAENDLRMTKVQQKISGCFRSLEGAYIFCRVRGYLSTCRKRGVGATEALTLLFQGKLPDFVKK